MTIRLGLVGLGQIARAQHLPAIAATDRFALAAVASPGADLDGVPCYPDIDEMLAAQPGIDAVTLCTPPRGRFAQARAALRAGKHVMLEKPPCAALSEVQALRDMARASGLTLFASWHSRRAAAVEPTRALLATRTVRAVEIRWKEDVHRWHPGQDWIWEPGSLGVFDPGINALSIVTRTLPERFFFRAADLYIPSNRQAPIAARVELVTAGGIPVSAEFDWRETGPQTWDIRFDTTEGTVELTGGGSRLVVDGCSLIEGEDREYDSLYGDFARLIDDRRSDVDLAPLLHVADVFMLGRRHLTDPL